MKKYSMILVASSAFFCACDQDQSSLNRNPFGPRIVEAKGYIVPKDSMVAPKVILVDESKLTRIPVGTPKVVLTNTNIHPAGKPKVVAVGHLRVCTPGQDSFSLPKIVTAIDSPFMAGIPEVVTAKDPHTKDQNPYSFISFNKLQGLKFQRVYCSLEDRAGNLWFGTGGGVSKYDGKSFTHFTERQGLLNNAVLNIVEDKSGNLWFSSIYGHGVTKYDGKSFTHFTPKQGLINNNLVNWILADRSGNIWLGTDSGVSKYDGKSFTHFTEKQGLVNNGISTIAEDRAGNLWFGTIGGVSKYDGKSFTNFTEKEGLINDLILSINKDKSGNVWLGTIGGISKYDGKSFTNFTTKEGLIDNSITSILEDISGQIWFGTYMGISKYDGKTFTNFTESGGLTNNNINSIMQDRSGKLWFCTNGGVSRYDGESFTHFTEKEGISDNVVNSILEDSFGKLWFGTFNHGVSRYDGKSFTNFSEKQGLTNNYVGCITEDRHRNQWFGTGAGVSKYDGKSFTNFTEKEGLIYNGVTSIIEDRSGSLWIGTAGAGTSKYDGKSFTNFTEKQGLVNNEVSCIAEDRSGNLWFGTKSGGVSKYDGKSFTNFTEKEGLANNFVYDIQEDASGNLWFGTRDGVSRYDGKSFTNFTEKEGLGNNFVSVILKDKSGNLWFGTRLGFAELSKDKQAEINDKVRLGTFTDKDVFFKNYTYEDGFLGVGCNEMYESNDGTIWIGSNDRLTAFHPSAIVHDTLAPNIQVSSIELFNENIPWTNLDHKKDTTIVLGNGVKISDFQFDSVGKWYGLPENLSLPYNNNYINFNFIGITTSQPTKVKYQYLLAGLDDNWSPVTSRTSAPYGNLPHGHYIFKVKAMNSEGYWSKPFEYSFTIRPPWWKTLSAYCIYVLLLAIAVWKLHLYQKERTIKQERERAQARELEQAREIEKAYSALGVAHETLKSTQSQLIQSEKMASLGELTAGIAHEIQNPLNFVNNFSEVNKEMLEELKAERLKPKTERDDQTQDEIINDLIDNEEKINHHGKRADSIVKGMLEHSRASTGKKDLTDINKLADEYLRLSYHGLRAKDKDFNADIKTEFDESIGKINIIPQDIGRVLLNLYNNAFYAVNEKKTKLDGTFEPFVTVSTKKENGSVVITVADNGNGIPQKIVDKIFQPFFTTKPTGQGTGLGLSLSYDIVKAHGGEIKVESKEGEGSEFVIQLPA